MKIKLIGIFITILLISGCDKSNQEIPDVLSNPESTIVITKELESSEPETTIPKWQIDLIEIHSDSLAQNKIGLAGDKSIGIILPPSYDSSTKSYPVIYALAGFGESIPEYANEFGAHEIFNQMVSRDLNESIIVVIESEYGVTSSFYANSKILGNWEAFVAVDVVNYLDNNYRTLASSNSRGIMGYATGGLGAFHIAMKHPDVFSAVYCYAPGFATTSGMVDYIIGDDEAIRETITLLEEYENQPSENLINHMNQLNKYSEMNVRLCYGLSFTGIDEVELLQFPYKLSDSELHQVPTTFQFWENGFSGIENKVVKYEDGLRSLNAIAIEYGTAEEHQFVIDGCEYYYQVLTNNGIECTLLTNEGGHYSYDLMAKRHVESVFPFFDANLQSQ